MDLKLKTKIEETKKILAERLNKLVPADGNILNEAIRYSLLNTGKRLRPLLILETSKLFVNEINDDILNIACAVEMLHTFSLIHDDLPAMDDDDYRRGEPACHKKFEEYDAILAGDSLIFLAYEVVLKTKLLTTKKIKILLKISEALGYKGMCLGQSFDVAFEKNNMLKSSDEADKINTLKTGYLFKVCIEIGCIIGNANKKDMKNMIDFSINFGKAFQLMDDIEDGEIIESDIEKTRKKIIALVEKCEKSLGKVEAKNKDSLETLRLIAEFCKK